MKSCIMVTTNFFVNGNWSVAHLNKVKINVSICTQLRCVCVYIYIYIYIWKAMYSVSLGNSKSRLLWENVGNKWLNANQVRT